MSIAVLRSRSSPSILVSTPSILVSTRRISTVNSVRRASILVNTVYLLVKADELLVQEADVAAERV